jgi:hypothetical protein
VPKEVRYNDYIAALDWVDGIATDPLYITDADSMAVIDSIPQFGLVYDMEVSPDGRFLYNSVRSVTQMAWALVRWPTFLQSQASVRENLSRP